MTRVLVAAALLGSATTLVATPARADNTCTEHQAVEFDTAGFNTGMRARLCLHHGQPTRGAYAQVSWDNGGDTDTDGRRKFDSLVIYYQLQSYGTVAADGSCDLTTQVNTTESGILNCPAVYLESKQPGGWSTTGYILYNLDRDGEGVKQLDLTDTPVVPF